MGVVEGGILVFNFDICTQFILAYQLSLDEFAWWIRVKIEGNMKCELN